MNLTFNPDQTLNLLGSAIQLLLARPVVNGQLAEVAAAKLEQPHPEQWRVTYRTAVGSFWVKAGQEHPTWKLQFGLDGFASDLALDSFGLRFEQISGAQKYLRQGYHSWDGAAYVAVGEASKTSHALTQLLSGSGNDSVILGFDRHHRFQHTFTFEGSSLCIEVLWDRKSPERVESENLLVFEQEGVEEALRGWARQVARLAPHPPRIPAQPITGWCSWYNLYAAISEENILEHLRGVEEVCKREHLPMRVFQLDDGFTPEMGDWLEVKPQFPKGIKPLLDKIRAAGFVPGLWIAPFVVGNRSRLFKRHPDWVLHERNGQPLVQMRFYGEFRWHKQSEEYYILDATHPEAFEYLRSVFRTWRRDWGCEYFKTDFMFWGAEYGPDRVAYHTPGLTRIEVWQRVAQMIRAEIGDALWVGCGMPLWASVGLVEGNRTGRDVGAEWLPDTYERLHGLALRNFANHLLWEADPDCVLLRERFHHLSEKEQIGLALFSGMMGGVLLTSDALDEISRKRLALWRMLLQSAGGSCRFPLLGSDDRVLVQVRGHRPAAVLAFNLSDEAVQRTYPLPALGLPPGLASYNWHQREWLPPGEQLSVTLGPHQSALVFLGDGPLSPPTQLP
jgi:hypothetical protein